MTYRNDHEALQHRLVQLEEELGQARADRARLEAAAQSEAKLVGDLDRVRKELHARAPMKLPVLENLRVASPCHESWDAMVGDQYARHCNRCDKNVYNLSAMTRAEAHALLVAREGALCVRYYTRPDGTVMTADCPVGLRIKRLRYVAAAGVASLLAAGAVGAMFSQMGSPVRQGGIRVTHPVALTPPTVRAPTVPTGEPTMGDIAPAPVFQGQMAIEPSVPPSMPQQSHAAPSAVHTHMGRMAMPRAR